MTLRVTNVHGANTSIAITAHHPSRDPEVREIFAELRRTLAVECPSITPWEWEHYGLEPGDPRWQYTVRMDRPTPPSLSEVLTRIQERYAQDLMGRWGLQILDYNN